MPSDAISWEPSTTLLLCALSLLLHSTPGLATDLAGVSPGQVQHVEEQAQLAAQAELLLAQVILDQAADRLQEIQHLAETGLSGAVPGLRQPGRGWASPTWIMQLQ